MVCKWYAAVADSGVAHGSVATSPTIVIKGCMEALF